MKIIQGNGRDISVFIKSHQNDMKSYLESPGAILLRDFHCPTDVEVDKLSRDLGTPPWNLNLQKNNFPDKRAIYSESSRHGDFKNDLEIGLACNVWQDALKINRVIFFFTLYKYFCDLVVSMLESHAIF